jgi:hypothetical protein
MYEQSDEDLQQAGMNYIKETDNPAKECLHALKRKIQSQGR